MIMYLNIHAGLEQVKKFRLVFQFNNLLTFSSNNINESQNFVKNDIATKVKMVVGLP
jgi:hypothetical protein